MVDLKTRSLQQEIMDTQTLPLEVMTRTLNFLALTNRRFGGYSVIRHYLDRVSRQWNKEDQIRILDVGTGIGDIPLMISKWARQRKFSVKIIGVDVIPEIVEIAQKKVGAHPNIEIFKSDFWDLYHRQQKFDYVISSLFLHHISPQANSKVVKAFHQMAKKGILVSDLKRSHMSYWSIKLLTKLVGNRIVQHDGPLSVRRAFTLPELRTIAKQAGLPTLDARNEPWFRLSLSGEK